MRRIGLKNCPYCGSSKIYVSSSDTSLQKASFLFLLRLVRCHVCMRRHFRPLFLAAAKSPATRSALTKPADSVTGKGSLKRPA
jgi:hypothetical protein